MAKPTDSQTMDRGDLRTIAVVTAVGVGLRLALLAAAGNLEPHADESHYLYTALSWSHFGFYADTLNFLWPPGYPFLLKSSIEAFGGAAPLALKLAQVGASGVVGATTMLLALALFSRRAALVAGGLWCVHLPLAAYTHYLWPETFFLALLLPALYLLVRWWQEDSDSPRADGRLLLAGLLLGGSLLFKEVALYLCLLLAAGIGWRLRQTPVAAFQATLLPLLAIAILVLPLTLRNFEVFGRFVPVGETLGKNVLMGLQHPFQSLDYNVPGRRKIYRENAGVNAWMSGGSAESDLPEFKPERHANLVDHSRGIVRSAADFGFEHPGFVLRSRVIKVAHWAAPTSYFVRHYALERYTGVLDTMFARHLGIVLSLTISILVLAAAIPGLFWCLRSTAGRAVLVPTLLYFTAVAAPIQGASRYRVPIEPLLIVLAAGFLTGAGRPWQRRPWATAGVATVGVALVGLWALTWREVWALLEIVW